jgi:hypothetical protein
VSSVRESKIVFTDGGTERVIRGIIISKDDFFVTILRRDGEVSIAKNRIVKIDSRISGGDKDNNQEI